MAKSTATSRALRFGLIGCLFVLSIVIVGSALGYFFLREPEAALGPVVSFSYPRTDSATELNRPIQVLAFANDTDGVIRIELYANGALVAVQSATSPQGSNSLLFSQNWTPLANGTHILFLRAYNRNGQFADSKVVRLEVVDLLTPTYRVDVDAIPRGPNVPLPSLNQISDLSGVPLERLREANPQLKNVDPNTPLPAGTILDVPRSPAPPPKSGAISRLGGVPPGGRMPGIPLSDPPPPLPDAPRPPTGLTGTGDCNSVQLSWEDSPDEERYIVYRLDPGARSLLPVAVLPANTVSYRDTLSGLGTFHYFVAAVRASLEGMSAIFSYTTPAMCTPPPPPGTRDLLLTFVSIETTDPYEGVFCYFSINGNPHERVPAYPDEMSPSSGNPLLFRFSQLRDHGLAPLLRYPESAPVTLSANCQGRGVDGTSDDLGAVSASHPQADWDGTERMATARSFRLRYRIGPDTPEARRQSASPFPLPWPGLEPFPLLGGKRPQAVRFIPTIPEPINLRYNPNGREACDQLSHPGERLGCTATGRPTITWEWHGDESLLSAFWIDIDLVPTAMRVEPARRAVLVSANELWRLNRIVCGRGLAFHVKASPIDDVNLDPRVSEGFIEMPPCPSVAVVHARIDELVVGGSAAHGGRIVDNDPCLFCEDDDMEIYGSWMIWGDIEFDEYSWACCLEIDNPGGTFRSGDFSLVRTAPWELFRHPLQVTVPSGSSLWVRINLRDAPRGPFNRSDEYYCQETIEIPARTALEWQSYSHRYTISDDYGEASCRITVDVSGAPP